VSPRNSFILSSLIAAMFVASCGSQGTSELRDKIASPFASSRKAPQTPVEQQPPMPIPAPSPVTPQPQTPVVGDPSINQMPGSGVNYMYSPSTLYVVMAGNATCNPLEFKEPYPGLIKTGLSYSFIKHLVESRYVTPSDNIIFSCYDPFSPTMRVYDVRNNPQSVAIDQAEFDNIVLPQVPNYSRVVVMGHSYGGWRAMKLVSSPQFQTVSRGNATLVTIDPISKTNCNTPLDKGCRMAPTDFDPGELLTLNSRTKWLNAVQAPGIVIGSDAMPAAHVNVKLAGTNHFLIVYDARLWIAINEVLKF
jgi:hypothetical protein